MFYHYPGLAEMPRSYYEPLFDMNTVLLNVMFHAHLENNHRKIHTLQQIEILKAASSKHLLNDVIAGQNDPIYKLLPTSVI